MVVVVKVGGRALASNMENLARSVAARSGMGIALDLDGVLCDSMGSWVRIWNSRHPHRQITVEDIREWDFWKGLGISREEFNAVFDEVWRGWRDLAPLEDDIGGKVARLSALGRVDIVSGRTPRHLPYVKSWLKRHKIRYSSLILGVSRKSSLNHDVFIDDSPVEALSIAETARYVLLRDQPWNRLLRFNRFILRVGSLDEAYQRIVSEVFPEIV
jgi:uncharacterized HAD superfamily protein